jgi:hypothetical protein
MKGLDVPVVNQYGLTIFTTLFGGADNLANFWRDPL